MRKFRITYLGEELASRQALRIALSSVEAAKRDRACSTVSSSFGTIN